MMMLVTYNVNTMTLAGRRWLRQVAHAYQDFGQRVQFSVFEIEVEPAQWVALKARLEGLIDPSVDSLDTTTWGQTGHAASSMSGRSHPWILAVP